MLCYELLLQGHTVIAVVYAIRRQKPAETVRQKLPKPPLVHLLQDNARPHAAKATHQKIEVLD